LAVQRQCLLQQIVCRNHRVIYLQPFERRDCNLCLRIRRPTFSTTLVAAIGGSHYLSANVRTR
jgi:ribosomal protein S27E